MAYKPTWPEFWDWYSSRNDAQKLEMRKDLDTIISESSPKMQEEILKNAPAEFQYIPKATQDYVIEPEPLKTRMPEELAQERQKILNRLYNGQAPRIASVAEMRKHRNSGMDNRWTFRRIAYYFARGFLGGGGRR
jgi:hypothetical protein